MKKSIEGFCKARKNGLFLLDLPTGFGKTYNVLDFIADNYDKPEFAGSRFFFITTLKKNLPYKELRKRFAERGKQDVFDELSIFMQANADVVIENMDKIKFPKHIENKTECKELLNSVRKFEEAKKNKNFDVANIFKDRITESQERRFRDVAIGELRQFKTPKEKLRAIQNNPKFKWIGELYPAVYTIKKKILFMSIDKF